ncbi:MAG: hypothetical protein K2J54_00970 [Clostridia bacterium]|nr:hypothetical protein [Clostridia bacterium]
MKKRLIAMFAATAVATGTLCLAGCAKDSEPAASETYTGVVCSQTYSSESEAAAAFVAAEISGPEYQVTLNKYEKDVTLTESEVTALNISAEIGGTIQSVEKGKIYFSEVSEASAKAAAATGEADMYVTVYIIKYTPTGSTVSTYKYMIPLPANNEVLTASYFNSVMNPESYKNCTVTSTTSMTMSAAGQSQSESQTVTMQITETAVKMSMKIPVDSAGNTTDATAYLVDTASGVKCAVEAMGQCMVMDAEDMDLEVDSISELYASDISEAQYSLYVKTDYGFKMRTEALGGLIDSTFDAIFGSMGIKYNTDKATAEFKVVEGKMYKATVDLGISVSYEGQTITASSKTVVTYTNFGTTSVTVSDAAKAALGIS